jgi:hypothetical protein
MYVKTMKSTYRNALRSKPLDELVKIIDDDREDVHTGLKDGLGLGDDDRLLRNTRDRPVAQSPPPPPGFHVMMR